jgi:Putative DNA-binding domain
MSSLQGKPLEAITEQDLQQMVTQSEQESQTLEYKREPFKRNDEEIREMLRDITSIANAFGGDLLIGVDEDANGAALRIIGIKNPEEESQRIISSCLSNIAERIDGLRTHPVLLQNGSFILVLRIPRSLRAPHMVTFKGLNQFWIRHDRQKSPMSIHEIKDTCLKVEGIMEKLEIFLANRRQGILEDIGNIPHYVVSVTPLFVGSSAVDIHDKTLRNLLENPPPFDKNGQMSIERGSTGFTIHGLYTKYYKHPLHFHVFRNGHLEFWLKAEHIIEHLDTQKLLESSALNAFSFVFIYLANKVFTHIGLTDPIILSASFYNIKGCKLLNNMWSKDHLEIDHLQFYSLSPVKSTTMCSSLITSGPLLDYITGVQLEFGENNDPLLLTLPNNILELREKNLII